MYNIRRGDVFYISDIEDTAGSEQKAGRPAVVISNDVGNTAGRTAVVAYLTTQPKKQLPTHVVINATKKTSYVLCEQLYTVDETRIGDYIASLSDTEMAQVDEALRVSLDVYQDEASAGYRELQNEVEELKREKLKLEVERDLLKELYTGLQKSFIPGI